MTQRRPMRCAVAVAVVAAAACAHAAPLPGSVLQAQIDAAVASGAPSLSLPAGASYAFGQASLVINNATEFALLGSGATLSFYPGHGVVLANCSGGALANVTVVYDPPAFAQGVVLALNSSAATLDFALEAGFPAPDADFFNSGEIKLQYWDAASRLRLPQPPSNAVTVLGPVGGNRSVWRLALRQGWQGLVPPVGTAVTVSPRAGAQPHEIPGWYVGGALWLHGSAGVAVTDVTLLGSSNFAVLEWGGAGGHTYRRLTLDRAPGALLSSNTDGFHSFSTGRGGALLDSRLQWMGDDALNFHNRVQLVLSASGSDAAAGAAAAGGYSVDVVDVGDVPSPGGGAPARAFADLQPGDVLRIFRAGETGTFIGGAAVASVAWVTDAAVLAAARALVAALPYVSVDPTAVGVWRVGYLPADPAANGTAPLPLAQGDLVQFDRRSSAGALVQNTSFGDAYDSCARLQANGAAIVDSSFATTYSGITVVFDPGWLEGTRGLANVTIRGNRFAAIGHPPAANMSQVLTADRDVAGLVVQGNTVSATVAATA